jgi:tetratricopeptide (TPR) repeat protein
MLTGGRVTAGSLTSDLDRWIAGADAAGQPQRRLVALSIAVDAVWTAAREDWINEHRTNGDSWGHITPSDPARWGLSRNVAEGYVGAWVVRHAARLPASGIRQRLLLATIGLMEDGSAWHYFEESLPAIRAALPDESRVRLAEVLLESYRELGPLRMLRGSGRLDVLRDEDLPSSMTRQIPKMQARYDALAAADPAVAGEALLRAAYLDLRRRNWKAAVTRLEQARNRQTETILRAASDYFLGWTHARIGNDDDAIAAYRRALEVTPTMRNLATELSTLLFLRNERNEAYAILDSAFNATDIPPDFMVIIERADVRFVDGHLRAIREALK